MNRSKKQTLGFFMLGSLLGLAAFLLLFGISALNPLNDAFLRGGYVEKDIQQHYAGWLFYRDAPLSIPFCFAESLNWPGGLSVAFTDSIPLFAAFFRIISPLLPATFQYFGLYTLVCFVLQGGFTALLISLFTRKKLLICLGALPFVFSPILIERAFRHTSLAAHFLIVASLYYYFQSQRENRFAYKGLFALNCLAIALHPYFVPMTLAITFALLAQYALRNKQLVKPLGFLGANLAFIVGVGWLFGVFSGTGSGAGGSGISYGYFCMNLNALWNPVSLGSDWSLLLPAQNQVLGNYDGFNYLGLGLLLALILGAGWVFAHWSTKKLVAFFKRHGMLFFVCLCLCVFAVSNVITANGVVLMRFPLPQFIIGLATVLRSSGRLFWPVYYLLMLVGVLVCIVVTKQCKKPMLQAGGVIALCCVQLLDISPALAQKATSLRSYTPLVVDTLTATTPLTAQTSDFWQATAGQYQHTIALDPLPNTALTLALYCADNKMAYGGYSFAARYNEELVAAQVAEYKEHILAGGFEPGCVFVTEQQSTFLQLADAASGAGAWCGALRASHNETTETVLYVIAPLSAGYEHPLATQYGESFPLRIGDVTDDYWQQGVLCLNLEIIGREADKNKVVIFNDTPLARRRLEQGSHLLCDNNRYEILKVDDSDPGWLMVTLDILDAHALIGKDLTSDR